MHMFCACMCAYSGMCSCICGGKRTILGIIPQAPSILLFESCLEIAKLTRLSGHQVPGLWLSLLPSANMTKWTDSPDPMWVLVFELGSACMEDKHFADWSSCLSPVSPSSWYCGGRSGDIYSSLCSRHTSPPHLGHIWFLFIVVACQHDSALSGGDQSCSRRPCLFLSCSASQKPRQAIPNPLNCYLLEIFERAGLAHLQIFC